MSVQPLPDRSPGRRRHLRAVEQDLQKASLIPDPPPQFVRALAVHAFEAVEGKRTISQLGSAVTFTAARQLAEQRQALSERNALYRDSRTCAASPGPLHLCRVLADLAEASIALHTGRRTYAVSLRLEWIHGKWRASEVYVL